MILQTKNGDIPIKNTFEIKVLKQENRLLKTELNRKGKVLAELAALLTLHKEVQVVLEQNKSN